MADATSSPRQRQTENGRRAFLEQFPSPEARSEHFRDLARRSNEGRVVLNASEADALGQAYALLGRIAARGKMPTQPTEADAG
jgi:hypothetical protein